MPPFGGIAIGEPELLKPSLMCLKSTSSDWDNGLSVLVKFGAPGMVPLPLSPWQATQRPRKLVQRLPSGRGHRCYVRALFVEFHSRRQTLCLHDCRLSRLRHQSGCGYRHRQRDARYLPHWPAWLGRHQR